MTNEELDLSQNAPKSLRERLNSVSLSRPSPGGKTEEDGQEKSRKSDRAVPSESFDFLNGRFAKAARTRTLNLITAAIMGVVVVTMLAGGVVTRLSVASRDAETENATQSAAAATAELARNASSGAATASQVQDHIASRARTLTSSTKDEIDWPKILGGVQELGDGIRIDTVTFSGTGFEAALTAEQAAEAQQELEVDAKNGKKPPKVVKNAGFGTISMTGTITSAALGLELEKALKNPARFPWFTAGAVTTSCGANKAQAEGSSRTNEDGSRKEAPPEGSCTWTWTGELNEQTRSTRNVDLPVLVGAGATQVIPATPTTLPGGGS
jgi:hypothetical protein